MKNIAGQIVWQLFFSSWPRRIGSTTALLWSTIFAWERLILRDDWCYGLNPHGPKNIVAMVGIGLLLAWGAYRVLAAAFTTDADDGGKRTFSWSRLFAASMVVMAIIGVLAAMAVPNFRKCRARGRMGLATGGAKDVGTFRLCLANGFMPSPASLTAEGLFYDYHFEGHGELAPKDFLFAPTWSCARSTNPFTHQQESFLAINLESNIPRTMFRRKKLNLVVVLDISGSMSSTFDHNYYGDLRMLSAYAPSESWLLGSQTVEEFDAMISHPDWNSSKLNIAVKTLCAMLDKLAPEDRLGIVLYNHRAHLAKPLRTVAATNMARIKQHIMELEAGGGTDMWAGFQTATAMLEAHSSADPDLWEQRMIFLTDAMPTCGRAMNDSLADLARRNAARSMFTSFIGIGVDFRSDLVEEIATVRGANYYAVHSPVEFKKRIAEEFDYMVTPVVFDVAVRVVSDELAIQETIGSPQAATSTGACIKIETLFPAPTTEQGARGGIVLAKVVAKVPRPTVQFDVSYVDRRGRTHRRTYRTQLDFSGTSDRFDANSIRKAILLSRYCSTLRSWLTNHHGTGVGTAQSLSGESLSVDVATKAKLTVLEGHFVNEMQAIGDDTLKRELVAVIRPLLEAS